MLQHCAEEEIEKITGDYTGVGVWEIELLIAGIFFALPEYTYFFFEDRNSPEIAALSIIVEILVW